MSFTRTALGALTTAGWIAIVVFGTAVAHGQNEMKVTFTSPEGRPLANLAEELNKRHGWAISYEDAHLSYAGDIEDATNRVRKDLNKYPPGQAPKVIVPRQEAVSFTYSVSPASHKPESPMRTLEDLLHQYAAASGSVYKVMQVGHRLVIAPKEIKNRAGHLEQQAPILNTPISFTDMDRDGLELLRQICRSLSEATGQHVVMGTVPLSLSRFRSRIAPVNQAARDVLVDFLDSLPQGRKYVWFLYNGPGGVNEGYVLNLDWFPKEYTR